MEIREIQSKEQWEGFLLATQEKTFLHSWNWGEFQEQMRGKIWRLGLFEGEKLYAVAQIVRVSAKRGIFLLVPHGPIGEERKEEVLRILVEKLKMLANKEGANFIRMNPIWKRTQENNLLFNVLGCRNAPLQMHPEASWKLDISLPEEELFRNMRKTTRYLIKKAQENKDIVISQSKNPEDLKRFSELHNIVSKRQHFVPFSLEYLQTEFDSFAKDNQVTLFQGMYKGEVAASSFVVFWSGIGFYHHAVSLPQFAKFSVPYLLQWEAIKEAKRRGCLLYDFWGYVDPKSSHPWAGPTLFKMGFGGNAHEYVKTKDIPLSLKYWPTMMFEMVRKIRRHL